MTEMKENTSGQTVYEQLQEIQDKIGIKILSYRCNNCDRLYTEDVDCFQCMRDMSFSCRGIVEHEPISLARILSSLGEGYTYSHFYDTYGVHHSYIYDLKDKVYNRRLLNENNSDCMLSDQSPETIKAIWEIVCK